MNKPNLCSFEDTAIDSIVNILNAAKCKLGDRQNLAQLAKSRNEFLTKTKVSLNKLQSPLEKTCEKLIVETIDKTWKLTKLLKFFLRYLHSSTDETSHFLYYEAVFSQPSMAYPIPQATASVFFTVEDKHLNPAEVKGVPQMTFRIEGQNTNHDVRYVQLTSHWILAAIKMKLKLYSKIEALQLF